MISIKTVLRKKKLSTGKYPVYLRITKDRKSIFFRTPYTSLEKEWDESQGKFNKHSPDYLKKNRLLLKFIDRATSIITDLEQEKSDYTLSDVEVVLRLKTNPANRSIFPFWEEIISEQKMAGRTGNARIHSDTLKSVKKFSKIKELTFHQITPEFLEKYESWLRSRGGTDGGVGVKMRSIRSVFNTAIIRGRIKGDIYPFKAYKISKLKGKGIKKALRLEDIQKVAQLDLSQHPTLIDIRNYFIFSFYTRGMNFADMATLKWSNISDGRIYYTRSKTKGNFQIKILPPVQEILDYYKPKRNQTDYVFPILLEKDMAFSHLENRKFKTLKRYNKRLKEIAALCDIDKPLSSYVARHSYANSLKQKGISTDIISESMGHQNIAVTQAYLKELDNSLIDDAMEVLL
ncbi:site-specific integrase [Gaoshiqia sediminis]|uniref:Site-specific integrase n=1 Tax=Gaoshiqia sediminis TaxID=2986998 RepID=A0AA42C8R6_9BACT|nr:site-specific integrase [Gaoshiqia sediminis]MBN1117469.1 site-specific integrase [Bacteroidales bacterium]MCW0481190.1 site-specific integrase [Gaoshiqia sediminis]